MTRDDGSAPDAPAPDDAAAAAAAARDVFDPNADPLADPAFAASVGKRLLSAADHPWELEAPPDWDPLDAVPQFLKLVQEVNRIVGAECEADLWPSVKNATFHGELVLPPSALREADGFAVLRASNFGNLVAVLNDDAAVRPDVLAAVRRRAERLYYKLVPSTLLMRAYDGHHRGTRQFPLWRDRLFGSFNPVGRGEVGHRRRDDPAP